MELHCSELSCLNKRFCWNWEHREGKNDGRMRKKLLIHQFINPNIISYHRRKNSWIRWWMSENTSRCYTVLSNQNELINNPSLLITESPVVLSDSLFPSQLIWFYLVFVSFMVVTSLCGWKAIFLGKSELNTIWCKGW